MPAAFCAITRVAIRGAPRIMEERHAAREPHDVLGGQYSLPFTAAVALTRNMSNPLVYDQDAVADPLVRDLARRIELAPLEEAPESPGFWPAEIDGRRFLITDGQVGRLPVEEGVVVELGSRVSGWHEGDRGVSETAAVIDPNAYTPEFKGFLVKVEKA